MSEISDLLQQKAGLTPDQAQVVEQLVVSHLMSRVPSEFQGILGSVLGSGGAVAAGQPAASAGGLGSLLSEASTLFGHRE